MSQECKRVLAYAFEESEQLSHKHIGTEHMLLGLLREENCVAAGTLREYGFDLERVREEAARIPRITPTEGRNYAFNRERAEGRSDVLDGERARRVSLALDEETMRVLERSIEEAEQIGDNCIRPNSLLLGLLRTPDCAASQILREMGLDLAKAREEIIRRRKEKGTEGQ